MNQYFPYHIKRILVIHNPWILGLLWKVVSPWLDTNTQEIIHFLQDDKDLLHYIAPEHLLPEHGGDAPAKADPADLFGFHTLPYSPLSDTVGIESTLAKSFA